MTATSPPPLRRRDVAVLVPAAGLGLRLGGGIPKALHDLAGKPLLWHCWRNVSAAPSVGAIIIAAPLDALHHVLQIVPNTTVRTDDSRTDDSRTDDSRTDDSRIGDVRGGDARNDGAGADSEPKVIVVAGGATRRDSVAAALAATPAEFDIILVHDAARALTPPELIETVAEAVRSGHDAVIPGLPVIDTIKEVSGEGRVVATVDRELLRAVQTPQGFRREVLAKAHLFAPGEHTDDAGMVEQLGVAVHTVAGHPRALKITTPWDLVIAETILRVDG